MAYPPHKVLKKKPIVVATKLELKTLMRELTGIAPLKKKPVVLVAVTDCARKASDWSVRPVLLAVLPSTYRMARGWIVSPLMLTLMVPAGMLLMSSVTLTLPAIVALVKATLLQSVLMVKEVPSVV